MTDPRTYLLDAGNSRCKVALLAADGSAQLVGNLPTHSSTAEWQTFFASLGAPAQRALGVCVAGDAVKASLAAALGCELQWAGGASALPQFENHYETPSTLGADRFLAAYGAALHAPQSSFVLATFGTATTVDWVRWDVAAQKHCFEGGIIVAGLDLMLFSVARGTAQLPDFSSHVQTVPSKSACQATPRNTQSALLQGAQLAQVATVQAFKAQHPNAPLFLAGGRSDTLAPQMQAPHTVLNHPALAGLARLATLAL